MTSLLQVDVAWNFLDNLSEGVLLVHASGKVAYLNPAAYMMLELESKPDYLENVFNHLHLDVDTDPLLSPPAEIYVRLSSRYLSLKATPVHFADEERIQVTINVIATTTKPPTKALEAQAQLQSLTRISERLKSTLSLDDTMPAILNEAMLITGAVGGQVFMSNLANNQLDIQSKRGQTLPTMDALAVSGPAIKRRETMTIPVEDDDRIRVLLATPILYSDSVAGLICLYALEDDYFGNRAGSFLNTMANYAALAVGASQRVNQIQERNQIVSRRANQLERFVETSRAIHGERDLDEIYEDMAYAIQEGIEFNMVMLSLIDPDLPGLELRHAQATGIPLDDLARLQTRTQPWDEVKQLMQPEFALGRAFFVPAESRSEVSDALNYIPRLRMNPTGTIRHPDFFQRRWRPHDLFIIPLRNTDGSPQGLILLDSPAKGMRPDLDTARALEVFANQTAISIENIRLFRGIQAHASSLQLLQQVSQEALREVSFHKKLQTLVDGLQSLGWQRVILTLRDDEMNAYHLTAAGLSPEEESYKRENLAPGEVWQARFQDPEFLKHQVGACIFIPAEVGWMQENVEGGLQDPSLPSGKVNAWHPDDLLYIPLYDQHQRLNALIGMDQPHSGMRPNSKALQVIELFAQFASATIESSRLFGETVARTHELEILLEAINAISSSLDQDKVLQAMGERMQTAVYASSYALYRYDQEWDRVVLMASANRDAAGDVTEFSLKQLPLFAEAIEKRQTIIQKLDGENGRELGALADLDEEARTMILVPIPGQEHPYGLVQLLTVEDHEPFDNDIKIIEAIASQGSISLSNVHYVGELQGLNAELDMRVAERTKDLGEERDRSQQLVRIATELSTSLDEQHVLNRALELIREVVPASGGAILLLDSASNRMMYRAVFGDLKPAQEQLASGLRKEDNSLAAWLVQQRRPALIPETRTDQRWTYESDDVEHRSALGVPLISSGEVIGACMMVHHHPDAFNDSHLSLVEAAINQVANALYNAQLYLLIRDQAERLGKMLRVEQVEAAKNQAILESIADGVLVADEAGVITVANLATSQILDVNREQLLGRGVRELSGIYGPSGDKWINAIQKWARNPEDVAERAVLEDQITVEEKVINVLLSPVFARNRFFGTVSIFRDITQAVEVDRIKSEFVSTVSHELRTPMTSIKGYADLILMGVAGKLSPSQSQYVEVIKDNADRLSVLVNDLLDISRIETGKVELDLRSMDVGKVVQDVVNSHLAGRIQHEAKTINASVEVVGTLPQVRGDVARVTQILTNLVDNAFNYTLEGGRIRVRAEAVDGHVAVSVADTGIGISPEDLPKIFDRFYRADDDEVQRISGTGLGLAIVNSLVEMHGGVLEVNSKPGRGSIFSFTLPLAKGADAP